MGGTPTFANPSGPQSGAPAAPVARPAAAPAPSAPAAKPTPAPSPSGGLWHKILGVGMLALGAGLAGEGAAGPGPAAAAGAKWMQQERQFALKKQYEETQLAQAQQQLGIAQQHQSTFAQQVANEHQLQLSNMAVNAAHIHQLSREVALLPHDAQQQYLETYAMPMAKNLMNLGALRLGNTYSSLSDANVAAAKMHSQDSNDSFIPALTGITQGASGYTTTWGVYKMPPGTLQQPLTIDIPGVGPVTYPAGTPFHNIGTNISLLTSRTAAATITGHARTHVAQIAQSGRELAAMMAAHARLGSAQIEGLNDNIGLLNRAIAAIGTGMMTQSETHYVQQLLGLGAGVEIGMQQREQLIQQRDRFQTQLDQLESGTTASQTPSPGAASGTVTVNGRQFRIIGHNKNGSAWVVPVEK